MEIWTISLREHFSVFSRIRYPLSICSPQQYKSFCVNYFQEVFSRENREHGGGVNAFCPSGWSTWRHEELHGDVQHQWEGIVKIIETFRGIGVSSIVVWRHSFKALFLEEKNCKVCQFDQHTSHIRNSLGFSVYRCMTGGAQDQTLINGLSFKPAEQHHASGGFPLFSFSGATDIYSKKCGWGNYATF